MKRSLSLLLCTVLVALSAGCTSPSNKLTSPNDTTTTTTTSTSPSAKPLPKLENTADDTARFYTGDLSEMIGNQRIYSLSDGVLRYKEWNQSTDFRQTDAFFPEDPDHYIAIEQNVVAYWVFDEYIFCFKENGAFSLVVNDSIATSYPLTLPEELAGLEKQDVFGFQGSWLLGGLNETSNTDNPRGRRKFFVYDLNTGKLTWLTDRYVNEYSAALLNGVVYYSYSDSSHFHILAYDIESGETTVLHDPVSTGDSVLTYLKFFDRSVLLVICAPMNGGDPPTYKLWNVDDNTHTWTTVKDAEQDGYRVLWRENDCAYVLPSNKDLEARTDSLAPLSRYDYATGALSFILYLPYEDGVTYSHLPDDDAVYCRIGDEFVRFSFPMEE